MSSFAAITITPQGQINTQEWQLDEAGTLPHLAAVGGYVDVVSLSPTLDMWVNDEGLLVGLPLNRVATTELAAEHGHVHQVYVGPVVLTGGADAEDATRPLDAAAAAVLKSRLDQLAALL